MERGYIRMNNFQMDQIIEKRGPQYLSFLFEKEDLFSHTGYKVLGNQQTKGIVPCCLVNMNGKNKLFYDLYSYKPLKVLLPSLDSDKYIAIILDYLNKVRQITNNGFIQIDKIGCSPDYIFVDKENRAALIYFPVNIEPSQDSFRIFNENVMNMVKEASEGHENLDDNKLAKFSIELSNRLDVFEGDGIRAIEAEAKLVRVGKKAQDIIIDKSEIVIGKNRALVDVVISFNPAISRKHCKIVYTNDRYHVMDLGSANGTYINGVRIKEQKLFPIEVGDEIRLANCTYVLKRI